MSKALRAIVERLGNQAGIVCCAVLLDLPERHPDADGLDAAGRSVFLVGKHFFGEGPAADIATQTILNQLREGHFTDAVHLVVMAPNASEGIARAIESNVVFEEMLLHGPRGTGKTHALAAAAIINAELHLRAGFPGPFKVSWLHDSLKSASAKTAESLKLPMWGGLWTIKEDNTRPLFNLAGHELVRGDFIGCRDEASAQRLRQDAHMILAEELVASMTDGLGITQEEWELARSSAIRLETRRRSSLAATNPGSPDLWPAPYFGVTQATLPTRTAISIPITDRMTPEQQAVHNATFAGTSSMHRRLGRGEWVMAEMGAQVAEGFESSVHVAKVRLMPHPNFLFAIGWDGGHCYDDQTEVLTDHGWFRFADLPPRESVRFATLNPNTRELEYHHASEYIRQNYRGTMLQWEGEGVNLCVTPEHRVPWFDDHDKDCRIRWSSAQELADKQSSHTCVSLVANWKYESDDQSPIDKWTMGTYCRFMGWYLSEGSTERVGNYYRIQIAQEKQKYLEKLESDLQATGLPWVKHAGGFRVSDSNLGRYLESFRRASQKHVPASIKWARREHILDFLDTYVMGDGYIRTRKDHGMEMVASTVSDQLKDDLQELALKVGWASSSIWEGPGVSFLKSENRTIKNRGIWRVRFKRGAKHVRLLQRNLKRIDYNSEIYCVTVPNHIIYVRRKGKPSWNGNSPSAVMGQNLGGQSQIFAGLNALPAGVLELIERHILPWLQTYAPFALQDYGASLVHIIDPNMSTPGQVSILESAEKMIRTKLGGRIIKGPVRWAPRREAILKALRPAHVGGRPPLLISACEETDQLVHAFEGRWYYKKVDQQVDRTGPEKPNSPWADLGDAAAYLLDWLQSDQSMSVAPRDMKVEYGHQWSDHSTSRVEVFHG